MARSNALRRNGSQKSDARGSKHAASQKGSGRHKPKPPFPAHRKGADVAIAYLPEEQSDAEETRDAVSGEGTRCLLLPGDVRDVSFCERAVKRVVDEYGQLDILVNNAAFQHQQSIEDISDEQFDRTFRTYIFGYFYMLARRFLS